jgi:hypothetical protein
MSTISGSNSRDRSRIYREQIVTMEDLDFFKSDLLGEKKIAKKGFGLQT